MKPKHPVHVKKSREESNSSSGNNNNDKLQQGDFKRRKLSDLSPDNDTHTSNTRAHPQHHRSGSNTPLSTSNLELLSDHATHASASSTLAALSQVALDRRGMAASSPIESAHHFSDHHSHHSVHSLELGAVPSWESAGRPLAGWSSVSSAFSFSDALRTERGREGGSPGGGGAERGAAGGHATGDDGEHEGEEEKDPSPKSILSKVGEKRKTLAPGTHVQFSREAAAMEMTSSSSVPRKRSHHGMVASRSSSGYPPPPAPHDEYYYDYHSQHHGAAPQGHPYDPYPPPHSRPGGPLPPPLSSGHRPSSRDVHHHHYPEEDPYYDHYYDHPYGGPPPPHPPYGYSPHPRGGGGGRYPPSVHPPEEYPPPHGVPLHHHRGPSGGGRGPPAPSMVHTPPSPLSSHRHHRSSATPIHHPHGGGGPLHHQNPHHHPHHPHHHQFSHRAASSGPSAPGGWSKDDDVALMEIMKKHKSPKNWDPIAKKLCRDKSSRECQERWTRYLKPGSRKGQWTNEEDAVVLDAVQNSIEDPFTRWSDLAQRLPGRVGKQVRDRWVNHLNPAINHLPFSREDDLLLWEGHHLLGKRWVEISSKYFKGTRSENHIKNRWYSASFKKFIAKELGPDAYRLGNDGGDGGGTRRGASVMLSADDGGAHLSRYAAAAVMVTDPNGDTKYVDAPPVISRSETNMASQV